MKTNLKNMAMALFTISTILWACQKEPLPFLSDNQVKSSEPVFERPDIRKGLWKIVSYEDGSISRPETMTFLDGYILKFNDFNVVLGRKKDKTIAGKWNYITEKNVRLLVVDFGFAPLIMINNHWQTKMQTTTKIYLAAEKNGASVFMNLEKFEKVGLPDFDDNAGVNIQPDQPTDPIN
jgi:hypothetical protein